MTLDSHEGDYLDTRDKMQILMSPSIPQVLLCALLGTTLSKPLAEPDERIPRSAKADAEANADADPQLFGYSSPSGSVSFGFGGVRKDIIFSV